MKTLKKILLIVIVIIVLMVAGGMIFISKLAKRGSTDYNRNIKIEGLEKPVKVYRDMHGIPHIYASTEHDLYMATGYVMAQERLWQMDLLRRVTLGRLAEIFGDEFIDTDLLLRSLQYSDKSKKLLNESQKEIKVALEAYTCGVNSYIEANKGNYPLEFYILGYEPEMWEPVHSLNLIGYMAWDLKSGWGEFVLESIANKIDSAHFTKLLPNLNNQKTYVFDSCKKELFASNILMELEHLNKLGLDVFCGSNNWAVSGKKSVSGKPLLANDMHLAYNLPGTLMQLHQVVEGKLNVSGLALPGQPFIVVGHNDSIAWGMTNTCVDNLDYYDEQINPEDSNQYLFNGEWLNFEVHNEIIVSKGGTQNKRIYKINHRGPIVSDAKRITNRVITMRWTGNIESNEIYSIYMVNRAKNWKEFMDAFRMFRSISQNIVYADVQGNIGLYCCAGVPIRKRDKVFAVLPGWTDAYDWKEIVPFNELPHIYNPECGYVSSANNHTVDSTYPYYIGTWYAPPYRIDRIREMMKEKEKFSVEDFKEMQNDQHSKYAQLFLSNVLPFLKSKVHWSETEQTAINLLVQWNYEMSPDKAAPTLLDRWSYNLMVSTFKDEMGDDLFEQYIAVSNLPKVAMYNLLKNPVSVWVDNIDTKEKESLSDLAVMSFKETVSQVVEECGTDTIKWHWGNFHQITLAHPLSKVRLLDKVFKLNRGPYKVGGSYHTVAPYSYPFYVPGKVDHGASHRSIYNLANWDESCSVIPTGMSGIVSSDYYCDQTKLYITGAYHEDYYTFDKIKENAKYSMSFLP